MTNKINERSTQAVYTKDQLLASKKYAGRRDIVNALLDNNKQYTTDEVDTIIENYMKGKVK